MYYIWGYTGQLGTQWKAMCILFFTIHRIRTLGLLAWLGKFAKRWPVAYAFFDRKFRYGGGHFFLLFGVIQQILSWFLFERDHYWFPQDNWIKNNLLANQNLITLGHGCFIILFFFFEFRLLFSFISFALLLHFDLDIYFTYSLWLYSPYFVQKLSFFSPFLF